VKSMLAGGAPLLPTFPNSLIASVMTSLSFSFSISARISSPSNMLHRVQRVISRIINTPGGGTAGRVREDGQRPRPDLQATAGSAGKGRQTLTEDWPSIHPSNPALSPPEPRPQQRASELQFLPQPQRVPHPRQGDGQGAVPQHHLRPPCVRLLQRDTELLPRHDIQVLTHLGKQPASEGGVEQHAQTQAHEQVYEHQLLQAGSRAAVG
jgi:hypothetical protein